MLSSTKRCRRALSALVLSVVVGLVGAEESVLPAAAAVAVKAAPDPAAFSWAVERNDLERVTAWLDEGLDPEYRANQIGTGLMIAAWYGQLEMMELFVARGANPRRANTNGEQPLQLAVWNGHLEAAKWLLDHGARLDRDGDYWGALHYAVFKGHQDIARYLIERGARVDARSPNGSTPLMMAAREGRQALAQQLIEAGADPRAKNDWGDSALTLAMRYNHYELGKLISTAEEFAVAAKTPQESFGAPTRSASAPSEIEQVLQRMHQAEAEGRSAAALQKELRDAVNAFKRKSTTVVVNNVRPVMPLPYQPRSIVITAKRGKPGAERARVVVANKPSGVTRDKREAGNIVVTRVDSRAKQARVADLMRQIRLAEADGRSADNLRAELYEAVEALKQP